MANRFFRRWLVVPLLLPVLLSGCQNADEENHRLRVSGNIELDDTRLSFKIPGLLAERMVDEGEPVTAGQVVARMDTGDLEREVALRQAEVDVAGAVLAELEAGFRAEEIAQAAAAVERAVSRLEELQNGSRPQEIAAAEATTARAAADLERFRLDYERQQTLHQKEVISDREFELARSAYTQAQARLREAEEQLALVREGPRRETIAQAEAALREAEERHRLLRNGPRPENIAQARARLQQAREAQSLAEIRFDYATLRSPLTGTVLAEHLEPGEYVSPGTAVMTVGNLAQIWLRAYVDETDLGRVRLGQPVEISTDTYPDKTYSGRITFIADEAEFTPKSVQTEKERVKLVYRIKIQIDNPQHELKPGMPADGRIRLNEGL
ncbi:MAG: efflux RND transporter periplasmic adaptor subunit [Acidobacteria bacterium]|nr:efflux RND transporter periplasmic adaptor subunit [Acidobacteriota bacterium]